VCCGGRETLTDEEAGIECRDASASDCT